MNQTFNVMGDKKNMKPNKTWIQFNQILLDFFIEFGCPSNTKALFSSFFLKKIDTIVFSFVFDKDYLIMD